MCTPGLRRGWEGDEAVFAALALGDPAAAGVEVDVGDPDPDELGDPDPGVQQGRDQDAVAGAAGFPDGAVERADFGFGGHVGQLLGSGGDLDVQLGARCRNTAPERQRNDGWR